MKGLETTRNKDKSVTALVTTLLGWRLEEQPDHSFNPKNQNIGSLIPVQELSWNIEMTLMQLQNFV